MKLAKREKYLITLGICVVAVGIVMQLLVLPFFESRSRLQSSIVSKEKSLQEIVLLSQEYHSLEEDSETLSRKLAKRSKKFTLFSFLEKAAGTANVKDHIKYMKPSASTVKGDFKESLVEMKLEKINLIQFVSYLELIESPDDIVSIKRLSVQSNKKDSQYLDAVLQVMTFAK